MLQQLVVVVPPSRSETSAEVLAAVDLGSNSFHMIVGELRHGQMVVLDRLRETVRLAEGLSKNGEISAAARVRAVDCLARFGQRLREVHAANVRAAGTSTLRRAQEDSGFLAEAEAALGHPIEIIPGHEEARLIYKGVVHSLPPNKGLRLVMDIGGGSTEVILGMAAEPQKLESLHLGCVSMTEQFFPDGRITKAAFEAARRAARLELRPVKSFFRDASPFESIGTSGTILATENVATALGLIDSHTLTRDVLEQLIERVLGFDSIENLKLIGLADRRAQVWPGGLAILVELITVLRVEKLAVSDGALREGLLYDLAGRLHHEDARERSVRAMMSRFQVDAGQAKRVVTTAILLHAQCAGHWQLKSPLTPNILKWSAELHEIGLDISHDGYQRHGAYIAEHADMPGFPRAEQRFLAYMIQNQRHQPDARLLQSLPRDWRESALRLSLLLRLAVLLNRSRTETAIPPVKISVQNRNVALRFDPDWLALNPLTVADLEREQGYLQAIGFVLTFS
ncbi:MAG: Ppx/GppA family phosphatase [Gammaproteobacteria bacterium]|nr:Ppx/GppA family phosphatase [Gammaproteobacteria bacterium]MDH5304839.1 Ppx/GppA family phosphatase [Gammaproteobacteria bacterium]MDH5322455.1 Ppx/GppA family phosphatase [Gammaproteobacteria bacterium]